MMQDWKIRLRSIVDGTESTAAKSFALIIQSLIIFSLVSFTLETLPDLSKPVRRFLVTAEVVSVAIFTIEYLARIIVAESRRRFIFSFLGMVDLFAILPFYVATGIDLRSLRAFRLFRLFRILKIVRFNRSIHRFRVAFWSIRQDLAVFLMATAILIYLAAVGIYYFENAAQPDKFSSVLDSLWWAVVTLTTVGYGDVYPVTAGGRIFTFVVLVVGLGIIAVPTGLISSALTVAIAAEKENNGVVVDDEGES